MKLQKHIHIKESENAIIVFDSKSGELYEADNVSKDIFLLLKNDITEQEILKNLYSKYPAVSKHNISNDILDFIETLKSNNLIYE